MFDTAFLLTIVIIMMSAVFGGYIRGRQRDRVLSHFNDDQVTVEMVDGRLIWGTLHLASTGLEIVYDDDLRDEYHIETSFLIYKDEYPQIQAIYRYCDNLPDKEWDRRQRVLERTVHPGPGRRLRREARNFVNMTSESISQAIGVIIGRVRTPAARFITEESQEYIKSLGANIVGYVGTSYDPLLEGYVGSKVVVEVTEDGVVFEHVGILKDYTADFLEIFDVHYPMHATLVGDGDKPDQVKDMIEMTRGADKYDFTNVGHAPLYIEYLRIKDQLKPVNAVLDEGDTTTIQVPPGTRTDEIEFGVKVVRFLDWIVPRGHALIRHRAERYDPGQVFDIGFVLNRNRYAETQRDLQHELEEDPTDSPAAIELGQILFRRGLLDEAERYFHQALLYRDNLPDYGKLAARQLRYIRQKKDQRKRTKPTKSQT